MKSWTVYKHVSPNDKVYIGITSNVIRRWAASGYYYHLSDTLFSRALKKYGWDNFQHVVIQEGLTKEEACNMEKELIAYYKVKGISYNLTDGGEGYAGKHSEKHVRNRVKSRVANNDIDYLVIDKDFNYVICNTEKEAAEVLGGSQRNIAHVLRQPIGYTFKKHYIWKHKKNNLVDIEAIKKQILNALALRKKRMSEHTKAISKKMVAASKKECKSLTENERKERFATRTNNEEVVQILGDRVINTFRNAVEARDILNISSSNILECAKGKRKTAGGFSWKFKKRKEIRYDS